METADSAGHQLSQCGYNIVADVPVGALYRAGHVVVECGFFGAQGMERPTHLRLRENREARWPARGSRR